MENLIGTTKLVSSCSWYNMPTLFRNLQKRSLAGKERGTLQTRYPYGPQSGFPFYSRTTPLDRTPPIRHQWTHWRAL